jgi:hypothetical protein
LTNDIHTTEIYYAYGYALARVNQCGDALKLVQQLQTELPSDDEGVNEATTGITNICQENLDNPAVDTPTATIEATSTPEGTDTPEPTVTSEATDAP